MLWTLKYEDGRTDIIGVRTSLIWQAINVEGIEPYSDKHKGMTTKEAIGILEKNEVQISTSGFLV